jgi:hypothetical protein
MTEAAWRRRLAAAGLLLMAGLAGCMTPSRGRAQNSYAGSEGRAEIDESIGDRDLERKFVLVGTRTERRDDRLFIQFELKNTTAADLAIEWAVEWRDAGGFRIDTARHWTPAVVGGGGVEPIAQTAPVPEAIGFKLHIRESSPVR